MPKLLLKESPCLICTHFNCDVEVLAFDAEEVDGEAGVEVELNVPIEYCEFVTNLDDFYECRYGVMVDGKQGFPWCAFHRRRKDG